MATSDHHKHNAKGSSDDSDYKAGFYRDALRLIVAGYERLIGSGGDYSCEEEPAITGEIVRCGNDYIEDMNSSDWVERYSIEEEHPEHDKDRKGKSRKRVDVFIRFAQKGVRPRIRFEAKRLKMPGFASSKYVGTEGLGEFIAGHYAVDDNVAGMLGYVQSNDCSYWAKDISDVIDKKKQEVCLAKYGQWEKASLENVNDCYQTRHKRAVGNRELLIYHLLLDFVEQKGM